jgi:hypothetical protein
VRKLALIDRVEQRVRMHHTIRLLAVRMVGIGVNLMKFLTVQVVGALTTVVHLGA